MTADSPVRGSWNPILIDDELWELTQNPDNPSLASLVNKAAEAVDLFSRRVARGFCNPRKQLKRVR